MGGTTALFGCRCGVVQGRVEKATRHAVVRAICYCDDCQAAAHHLGRADLLDARGGSDVVLMAPARVSFTQGAENIVGLRLKPKGLLRFHTRCCQTPAGHTSGGALPLVGLQAAVFGPGAADRLFGKPRGALMGQFALGGVPPGSKGVPLGLVIPSLATLLGWRLAGRGWPNPLLDRATRQPLYPVSVLTQDERERLRPFCGPSPQAF